MCLQINVAEFGDYIVQEQRDIFTNNINSYTIWNKELRQYIEQNGEKINKDTLKEACDIALQMQEAGQDLGR